MCFCLTDCWPGSGTAWLTVNLSWRCTAEGNRIIKLHSFAEIGSQHWIKRVQGEYLAGRVSTLTMEWQQAGKNFPEMFAGMATFLQAGLEPERMLDLVLAWEVRYDCFAIKFKPANTQVGRPQGQQLQDEASLAAGGPPDMSSARINPVKGRKFRDYRSRLWRLA